MKPKSGEIDNDVLLKQAQREIEKAKGYFEDVESMIRRAIAIQWLLDRNNWRGALGLSEAINEMVEQLEYYYRGLDDPGDEGYIDLTQSIFLEHTQMEFCAETIEKFFAKEEQQDK